jgi:hypothetical protein
MGSKCPLFYYYYYLKIAGWTPTIDFIEQQSKIYTVEYKNEEKTKNQIESCYLTLQFWNVPTGPIYSGLIRDRGLYCSRTRARLVPYLGPVQRWADSPFIQNRTM